MKNLILPILIIALLLTTGCTTAINGVKHREMSIESQVLKPVFLPSGPAKVFVQVTNLTPWQVELTSAMKNRLAKQGAILVDSAEEAQMVIGVNLIYFGKALYINPMGQSIQSLQEMQIAGQTAGLVANAGNMARLGTSSFGALGVAGGISLAAGVASTGMSKVVDVREYAGVVDLEVLEKETGKVHETRIVITVKQTNLKEENALTAVQSELAALVARLIPST